MEKGSGKNLTLRKEMAEVLGRETLDLRGISKRFGVREKEALEHLEHIAKSVRSGRLIAEPARCDRCGFSFRKRSRLSTPSRCPVCKGESVTPPLFKIEP